MKSIHHMQYKSTGKKTFTYKGELITKDTEIRRIVLYPNGTVQSSISKIHKLNEHTGIMSVDFAEVWNHGLTPSRLGQLNKSGYIPSPYVIKDHYNHRKEWNPSLGRGHFVLFTIENSDAFIFDLTKIYQIARKYGIKIKSEYHPTGPVNEIRTYTY